ncbi:MAG TPA: cell envelope integrity protein CreD [Bacteroidales bacterium]|nr:cell envelope integrity protein CreD [Bacteroidales bacterium]HNS46304.1 cell envelope integrity protein CreD [Bacteroidales bacterium]
MAEKSNIRLTIKGFIVTVLMILLLIPTFIMHTLVDERKARQQDAFCEISDKWARAQTLAGPVLSFPYEDYYTEPNGSVRKIKKYIHILPGELTIQGELLPEKRYRGIYETVVYKSDLEITGSFSDLWSLFSSIQPENVLFDEACLSMGITDLRGIENNVTVDFNDTTYPFNSGVESTDLFNSGINARIPFNDKDSLNDRYNFSINLKLRGSEYIYFTPVGKETTLRLTSSWKAPSFDGAFLPDSREIKSTGFTANWKVFHLNRNYPQSWLNSAYSMEGSSFGVTLYLPVDNYTKTDRSLKYAILFIALTFIIFFFLELINHNSINPLQYILIGFALSIFYILLLSISEQLYFNIAYLIASIMTIGIITWYSGSILKEKKLAYLVGGSLVIIYGFIFVIIQVQDYALLIGSLGIFIILTVIMYFSRKIDWKGVEEN